MANTLRVVKEDATTVACRDCDAQSYHVSDTALIDLEKTRNRLHEKYDSTVWPYVDRELGFILQDFKEQMEAKP